MLFFYARSADTFFILLRKLLREKPALHQAEGDAVRERLALRRFAGPHVKLRPQNDVAALDGMSLGVGNMARLVFIEEFRVGFHLHLNVESGLALVLKRSYAALRLILPVDLAIKELVLVRFAERKRESFDLRSKALYFVARDLTVAVSKLLNKQVQPHVAEREEPAFRLLLVPIAANERNKLDLLVAERVRVRKVKAEGVGGGGSHSVRLSWSYGKGVGCEMVLVVNLNEEEELVSREGDCASETMLKLFVAERSKHSSRGKSAREDRR